MENRFANVGNVMVGEAYIHRKELEERLQKRTVKDGGCGSVNLVGLQRMGKSSLVHNALLMQAKKFYEDNIIVVKINANESQNSDQFFKSIVDRVYREIKRHKEDLNDEIQEYYDNFQNENIEKNSKENIRSFFTSIKEAGKRVVCIVDEFDHAATIFKDYPESFGVLKSLATEPETYVAFVFVSWKPAEKLAKNCNVSSFSFFETIYVKSFSDDEMKEYYNNCKSSDLDLSEEEKKSLVAITGGHPYWSDFILGKYKDAKDKDKEIDLETIFHQNKGEMEKHYKELLDLLNEQDLSKKLYQIIFGPMDSTCTKGDIQTLCKYGILDNEKNPKLISDKLHEYMEIQERNMVMQKENFDFSPLWHDTERGLREILKNKLEKQYQKKWEDKILDQYCIKPKDIMETLNTYFFKDQKPEPYTDEDEKKKYYKKNYWLSDNLYKASEQKGKMLRGKEYKEDVVITLLEAIFTRGLFLLCDFEYDRLGLKKIFGEKEDFVKKALHLSDARNPYQHNNDELLREDYKKKTNEYCQELYDKINTYEKKNSKA